MANEENMRNCLKARNDRGSVYDSERDTNRIIGHYCCYILFVIRCLLSLFIKRFALLPIVLLKHPLRQLLPPRHRPHQHPPFRPQILHLLAQLVYRIPLTTIHHHLVGVFSRGGIELATETGVSGLKSVERQWTQWGKSMVLKQGVVAGVGEGGLGGHTMMVL